jgi:hypothetical protein
MKISCAGCVLRAGFVGRPIPHFPLQVAVLSEVATPNVSPKLDLQETQHRHLSSPKWEKNSAGNGDILML